MQIIVRMAGGEEISHPAQVYTCSAGHISAQRTASNLCPENCARSAFASDVHVDVDELDDLELIAMQEFSDWERNRASSKLQNRWERGAVLACYRSGTWVGWRISA